jgi:Reverse transcriptase (RNA-dependent DNA polymerase)
VFVLRQLAEKFSEKNRTLFNNFVDFKQAFDTVRQEGLWQVLRHYGVNEEHVKLLENLCSKCVSAIRIDGESSEWFKIIVGVRQGCNLSPYLFSLLLEAATQWALHNEDVGVRLDGQIVNNLRFADDIYLIAETVIDLQELTDRVYNCSKRFGLKNQQSKNLGHGNRKRGH